MGEDGISIKDLKLCLPFCIDPLINIINSCILDNTYPEIWKKAIVTPLPKISDPKEVKDLRPISILPTVSKIIERHIYNQIVSFSNTLNLIPDCQSGFRQNFSTTTSLVNSLNNIRSNDDKKESTCLTLLDFSKAFDTISHNMLLAKLHYFGFSANSIAFFKNFLTDRLCCVAVKKNNYNIDKSIFLPVTNGVPQGSILSPLLFSLYVADMNRCVQYSKIQQYADDSQIYISFTTENLQTSQEMLKSDLNKINQFSLDHNLKLNASKSQALIFNSNKHIREFVSNQYNVKIGDGVVPLVIEAKNLGIIFDTQLSFLPHINTKLRVAYTRLKALYRLKKYLSSKTKYLLCESLIISLFDYGDCVYGDSLTRQVANKIQKLQNRCLRFSFNIPYRSHITPFLNNNSILNMSNRRRYHMYVFVYKIIKTGKPSYLIDTFTPFTHNHATRNTHIFKIPSHRTSNFQKSFSFVAPFIWNELPNYVKNFSLKQFSSYIKNTLMEQQNNL